MNKAISCILFLSLTLRLISQSPYQLDWKKEVFLLGTSVALTTSMFLADRGPVLMTQAEIEALDPLDVNRFDRGATDNWSEKAHLISDAGLYAPMGMAVTTSVVLPVFEKGRSYWKDAATLSIILLESNWITFSGTGLVKNAVQRVRPYAYGNEASLDTKLTDADIRKSFFSRHTSMSAANSFFLARVYADYFPDSRWKPLTWGLAALVPAFTGYLRTKAGEHFPTDVIAGYAFGALVGYFVPQLHRVKSGEDRISMSLLPYHARGSNGLSMYLVFR